MKLFCGSSVVTRHWIAKPRGTIELLAEDADFFGAERTVSLLDQDLRLHQVDAGDHLGNRVLDLQARVDLDEVVLVPATRNSTVPALW